MKAITEFSGLQGSGQPSHTSGGTIRRLHRQKPSTQQCATKTPRLLSRRVTSLGRPARNQINETRTDSRDLIPNTLYEEDGRNDKIHIKFDLCSVICDEEEDAQDFIFHLGGHPSDQRCSPRQFSRLFKAASRQGKCYKLMIRSKPFALGNETFQPSLFRGNLKFRKARRNDGKIVVFITTELFLNINRALNHQRERLARQQDGAIFESLNPIQRLPRELDNVAPLVLLPNEHDNARMEYFEQILDALMADVRRAASVSNASGSHGLTVAGRPNAFSLWVVETCWDIGGTDFDARMALDAITPVIREWGGKRGWEGNEEGITTELSKSEWMVAYAKLDNRLRLEIRNCPSKGKKSYTAASIPELIAKIDEYRHLATERINDLWGRLRPCMPLPLTQRAWTAYAMEWGASCGNSVASKTILGMLMREGRFFGGSHLASVPGWEKIKRKACKSGILRFDYGAYHPIMPEGSEYRFTILDNPASFPGHNTETQPVRASLNSPTPRRIVRERNQIPPSPPFFASVPEATNGKPF